MLKVIGFIAVLAIIGGVVLLMDNSKAESVQTNSDSTLENSNNSRSDQEDEESQTATESETAESADDSVLEIEASSDIELGEVQEFTIDSFNFGYSETEIRVQEGDTVTINLTNSDGFHDWVLDEFGAETTQIREGETTSVTFVADTSGTYEYYCSVGSHRENGMVGTLIVE
jgi:plastocyanin